jgi:hypothetical protein
MYSSGSDHIKIDNNEVINRQYPVLDTTTLITSSQCTSWSHDVLSLMRKELSIVWNSSLISSSLHSSSKLIISAWSPSRAQKVSTRSGANLENLIVKENSPIGGNTAYISAHNALQNRNRQVRKYPFTDECTRYLDVEVECRATDSSLSVCNRVISLLLGA